VFQFPKIDPALLRPRLIRFFLPDEVRDKA
jgi:hypothetical protein